MLKQRDLDHYRRLAGIPVDLSQPKNVNKPASTGLVTEAAKVPQHRGELSPKTKKNMRQRVSCAKKALEFLELAREELMNLPSVDYMEDIPGVIKQLHHMLHGDDGTGGLHNLHRSFQRDFDDMDFPEELENTEPGMDGNPTEEEIKAKEKEKAKKVEKKEKEAGKKQVKEGEQAVDKMLKGATGKVNSIEATAQAMDGEGGNTADDDSENGTEEEERQVNGQQKPSSSGINSEVVKAAKEAGVAQRMLKQNPFGGKSSEQEEKAHKPEWLTNAEKRAEKREKNADEEDCAMSSPMVGESKKPKWLEKAEVKAEKKQGKKVSKKEEKKVNEATGRVLINKDWTKPGSDLSKKFAADAELNADPSAPLDSAGNPANVHTSDQGDLVYPVSNRSEGPNQMQTNPYNEGQKVHVPAAIKTALMEQIKEAEKNAAMFFSRKDLDSKNFYEDMAKAFTELHMRLDEGTLYSMKQAQILMTSMMNIFTSKIPPDVVKFIAAGGTVRPLKDYMKQVTGNFDQWHIHPSKE